MIVLERFAYHPEATLGYLRVLGELLYTVEQPWNHNQLGYSCIPEGRYTMLRDTFGKHRFFRLRDSEVVPRSAIEIHPANRASELRGCIAPGWELDGIQVLRSVEACHHLLDVLPERLTLWIRQFRPEDV